MTYRLAKVGLTAGDGCDAVVLVDVEQRAATVLWKVGAEPEQADPGAVSLIQERALTDPAHIAEAVFADSIMASVRLVDREFPDLPDALQAADSALARGQGGRELRPGIPMDVAAAVRDVPLQILALRNLITKGLDSFTTYAHDLEEAITQRIQLPNRRAQARNVDISAPDVSAAEQLARYLEEHPPAPTAEAPPPPKRPSSPSSSPNASRSGSSSRTVAPKKQPATTKKRTPDPDARSRGEIVRLTPTGYGFLRLGDGTEAFLPHKECARLGTAAVVGAWVRIGKLEAGNPRPAARQVSIDHHPLAPPAPPAPPHPQANAKPKPLVTVPDLIGMRLPGAKEAIQKLGFVVGPIDSDGRSIWTEENWRVVAQSREAGSKATKRSHIRLTVEK